MQDENGPSAPPTYQASPQAVAALRVLLAAVGYLIYAPLLDQGSQAIHALLTGRFVGSEVIPLVMFAIVFGILFRISYRAGLRLLEPGIFEAYLGAAFFKFRTEISPEQLRKRPLTFDAFIKGEAVVVAFIVLLFLWLDHTELLAAFRHPLQAQSWNMVVGLVLAVVFAITSGRDRPAGNRS